MCQAGLVELSALTPVVTLLADAGYQGLSAQTGGVVLTPRPADIEETIKAGVLEQGTVDVMRATGVRNRMMRDGFVHHGINLAFAGAMHRIDMLGLTGGRAVTVYAQHEVLKDLIGQRLADDGDLRFGVSDTTVEGVTGDRPTIRFVQDGRAEELECDLVIGCDRSRTYTRFLIPEGEIRTDFFRQYPFAWFGIPAEAPHRPRRVTEEPPLGLPGTMF